MFVATSAATSTVSGPENTERGAAMARAIHDNWQREMAKVFGPDAPELDIAFPFIKLGSIQRLFPAGATVPKRLITRLSFADMVAGVHDLPALIYLARRGTQVRALKRLHAKSVIARGRWCLTGSANLTDAALNRNHEFGALIEEPSFVRSSAEWFEALWKQAGKTWSEQQLKGLLEELELTKVKRTPKDCDLGLPDFGADATVDGDAGDTRTPPTNGFETSETLFTEDAPQFFVKMFGSNSNRLEANDLIVDDLRRGTTHYAYSYPRRKRPRIVQDGAVMFASRLGRDERGKNETWVFGRAIGSAHREGRDDATSDEISAKPWRADWPHYVRVHSPEFLAGTFGQGVPLLRFLEEHGPITLETTKEYMRQGAKYLNPKLSLRNQAQVRLSVEGFRLLNSELEKRFRQHGIMSDAEMAKLDWPDWALRNDA